MKIIKLSQGKFSQVDDEDYEYLNQSKWYATKDGNTYYAISITDSIPKKKIRMHRVILGLINSKMMVDHKDRDGLNNQRQNIRICTNSENQKNKKGYGTSKYLGVELHVAKQKYYRKKTKDYAICICKRWMAHIFVNGKNKYLGSFDTEKEAAIAYDKSAIIFHKEFANLNFI